MEELEAFSGAQSSRTLMYAQASALREPPPFPALKPIYRAAEGREKKVIMGELEASSGARSSRTLMYAQASALREPPPFPALKPIYRAAKGREKKVLKPESIVRIVNGKYCNKHK